MGRATANYFVRPPCALGKGQKVKYHLISITKSMAKIFIQTLCVFSQMKDTKHIRGDFHSVAWVMPQGFDFGVLGCPGDQKNSNMLNIMQVKMFILRSNWRPWGEVKYH